MLSAKAELSQSSGSLKKNYRGDFVFNTGGTRVQSFFFFT